MKILVIGDSIVDHYIYGKINRMSPENPIIPIIDIEKEEYSLGGSLNVVNNLVSLSVNNIVCVSGIIPSCVSSFLMSRGVFFDNCYYAGNDKKENKLSSSSSIIKTRVVNVDSGEQILRIDNRKYFEKYLISNFQVLFKKINLNSYDVIVISDYGKGTISDFIVSGLSNYTGLVFVDTKNKDLSMWSKIKNVIIKINLSEYMSIVPGSDKNIDNLIVTLGKEGAELIQKGKTKFRLDVSSIVENADVCGAGDIFLAGLVVNYLQTNNLMEAIRYANKCAAKGVEKPGTSVVSYTEIEYGE